MPKKYPKETKLDALVELSVLKDINAVHQITGIPKRTLRRWRAEMQNKQSRFMSEKSFPADIKRTQNTENGHKIPDYGHKTDQHGHKITDLGHKTDNLGHKITDHGHKTDQPGHKITDDADTIVQSDSSEKTYPYPLEEDELTNTDNYESFKHIRDRLMQHAQTLADDLLENPENVNLRSLALTRILDRIMQLDELIPRHSPEQVIRFEYVYDGWVHDVPPWHGASDNMPKKGDK